MMYSSHKFKMDETQVIIEVLCVKKAPKYFRIQLRVPRNEFRVVDAWKDLGDDYDGESPQPILDNIKVLEMEMKRELIEIDCI